MLGIYLKKLGFQLLRALLSTNIHRIYWGVIYYYLFGSSSTVVLKKLQIFSLVLIIFSWSIDHLHGCFFNGVEIGKVDRLTGIQPDKTWSENFHCVKFKKKRFTNYMYLSYIHRNLTFDIIHKNYNWVVARWLIFDWKMKMKKIIYKKNVSTLIQQKPHILHHS